MTGRFKRIIAVAGFCLAAAACASRPLQSITQHPVAGVRVVTPAVALECVPYARTRSGIEIRGDAWTWWKQAAGLYRRSHVPTVGAVIVFARKGGTTLGHVAVVHTIVSSREIRVDHANWLGKGRIFINDPVYDVSAANDWSRVRVWNADTGAWGGHRYAIAGFIGPGLVRLSEAAAGD